MTAVRFYLGQRIVSGELGGGQPQNAKSVRAVLAAKLGKGHSPKNYSLRVKTPLDDPAVPYVWTDLKADNQPVPSFDGEIVVRLMDLRRLVADMPGEEGRCGEVEVPAKPKAVPVFALGQLPGPSSGGGGARGGRSSMGGGGGGGAAGSASSGGAVGVGGSGGGGGGGASAMADNAAETAKEAAKQVGKLFSSTAKMAASFFSKKGGGGGSAPSAQCLPHILAAAEDASTPFAASRPEHEAILVSLWDELYPTEPYSRRSPRWRKAGFKANDPTAALRAAEADVLSLKALLYMASTYGMKLQLMMHSQEKGEAISYPVAMTAVSVGQMLADRLQLRLSAKELTVEARPFWNVFNYPEAFNELFCVCLRLYHGLWAEAKGTGKSADPATLMTEVSTRIFAHLDKGPSNYDAFINLAMVAGDLPF
eukprot:g590.t1